MVSVDRVKRTRLNHIRSSPERITCHLRLHTANRYERAIMTVCGLAGKRERAAEWLHPSEAAYLDKLRFVKRRQSYLAGRYAAKHAVAAWIGIDIPLQRIAIRHGQFEQPIVTVDGHSNIQVSITHCDGGAAAIAFHEANPLGIDMELVQQEKTDVLKSQLTASECNTVKQLPFAQAASLTLLWTAKESLSKVLKTGLTVPPHFYETVDVKASASSVYGRYAFFPQYRFLSFIAGPYAYAITYPRHATLAAPFVDSPLLIPAFAQQLRIDI
ncbi:4'-phosphopantetheinyl transferase superfamily protein [Paenibacillus sp. ACRRX]|uniref:4'-phosphopantetheinyl transferase family protein n=1 Tax=unclassified Paenibacillus TaxID=185978 RepID=UPI001EF5A486|nr:MULTISPECIES: 4'-phosphopantetheinyl transferase superfamily protein [unclassified Paenibacillus]MCG7409133.1 4'-phosphopantetheinyl transferase superfamily protein [Paenibacillus sp. ACRRX]MDK8181873.1 4'-phosphopantetheinyl transferase superfamily protein [Paenibacillus sp. UMB4589-SE434]